MLFNRDHHYYFNSVIYAAVAVYDWNNHNRNFFANDVQHNSDIHIEQTWLVQWNLNMVSILQNTHNNMVSIFKNTHAPYTSQSSPLSARCGMSFLIA